MSLTLFALDNEFAVCRLPADASVPNWATDSKFFSVTRTQDELSIVCAQTDVPSNIQVEPNWTCLKVQGPLDFSLTGVLNSLTMPLADAGISIFAISTFDTDYLMVKQNQLEATIQALTQAGHQIER